MVSPTIPGVVFLVLLGFGDASVLYNRTAPLAHGELLFVGASITEFWKTWGINVWNEYYEPLGAVNVGHAGDQTQSTIDRLMGGYVDDLKGKTRVVVLNIGNNDLDWGGHDEVYVTDQIGRILSMLQAMFPGVKVILLQVLPRTPAAIHQKARNTNAMIRKYDDGNRVRYLDMEDKFCTGLAQLRPGLYQSDGLHLVEGGYRVWATNMAKLLDEVLNG